MKKKTKQRIIMFIMLCAILAVVGCSKKDKTKDVSSQKNEPTKKEEVKKDDTDTSGYIIDHLTINIPESWTYKQLNDVDYFYPEENDNAILMVNTVDVAKSTEEVTEDFCKSTLESFIGGLAKSDTFEELDRTWTDILKNKGVKVHFNDNINNEKYQVSLVSFIYGKKLYYLYYAEKNELKNEKQFESIIETLALSDKPTDLDSSSDSSTSTNQDNKSNATAPSDSYKEGMYEVGKDIPVGEYVLYNTGTSGYFERLKDKTGDLDSLISAENFDYNYIVTVNDGEYLNLLGAYAVPIEKASAVDITGEGYFKVGVHIPAGEYKITHTDSNGFVYVYTNSVHAMDSVKSSSSLEQDVTVKVLEGEYLEIVHGKIKH